MATLCVTLTLLIGDIGFQGDDWWQFSWPFWNPFPQSIWEYAKASLRPMEGLYTVLDFELFGFNRLCYTLTSLVLLGGACLGMGECLRRAFPRRYPFATLAVFFGFLLPPISNLIYMFCTDNSRLASVLFWSSALAFQRWAAASGTWRGLAIPVGLYWLAALTYENTTFLVFAIPLLVWPVHIQSGQDRWDRSFLLKLSVAIFGGFAAFVAMRFLLMGGGAVGHRSLIPDPGLALSYLQALAAFLMAPLTDLSRNAMSWAWGGLVGLLAALALLLRPSDPAPVPEEAEGPEQGDLYLAGLGVFITALGMLPYLLAGYEPHMGFTSQSRIFSSASFGVAILLALGLTLFKAPRLAGIAKGLGVGLAVLMASFLADLRHDWLAAARVRDSLCKDLVSQVPDVASGTSFLFLDLQSYVQRDSEDRAVIFQGVDGVGEFVKILYGRKDLYAYFLYPPDHPSLDSEGRIAEATEAGLSARGSGLRPHIPLDTLLILKRQGDRLVLLDQISKEDNLAAVRWKGVSSVRSNMGRIRALPGDATGDKPEKEPLANKLR